VKSGAGSAAARTRNRRGEGGKLREEILRAAARLLEENGREDAVTLRAVARAVGISAPSIYAHFDDREQILDAVVAEAFEDLSEAISTAVDQQTDPVRRLEAGVRAYVDFGRQRPQRYRVLFGRIGDGGPFEGGSFELSGPAGETAFGLLVDAITDCVRAGVSDSVDPHGDAAALWAAVHGFVSLCGPDSEFPWPEDIVGLFVRRLARVAAPGSG
jgi:AcrR family transcriptional regulator